MFPGEPKISHDFRDDPHCRLRLVACFLEQVVIGAQSKACGFIFGQGKPVDHAHVCKYGKAVEL